MLVLPGSGAGDCAGACAGAGAYADPGPDNILGVLR
jgi:hypothetical protein